MDIVIDLLRPIIAESQQPSVPPDGIGKRQPMDSNGLRKPENHHNEIGGGIPAHLPDGHHLHYSILI
jgi:hypothetical protein